MKLGFVAAGSAFILSLLLGFLSGAGFLSVLLRAVFFAAFFLGLAFGARLLIARFLPELLGLPEEEGAESEAETGSRIDMVVGDEELGRMPGEETIARGSPRTSVDDEAAEEIEAFLPE